MDKFQIFVCYGRQRQIKQYPLCCDSEDIKYNNLLPLVKGTVAELHLKSQHV
jgi:hypothetical protein